MTSPRNCGSPKVFFYYYFPKKEEILAAIAQDFAKEVHAGFSAEDVASQESFPQAIRCILGYFLKVIQQNEALFTMAGTHGMLFSSLLKPQLENQALEHAIAYLKDHPGSLALTYPEYSLQILVRGLGDLYLDGVTDTHVMMTLIEETLSLPKGSLSS